MGRVEELPDDLDEKLHLKQKASPTNPQHASPAAPDLIDQLLQTAPFPSKATAAAAGTKTAEENGSGQAGDAEPATAAAAEAGPTAAMPPAMHSIRQYSADELVSMLNRTPLFMTTLDETDGAGGENVELEALRALAYEGTRAEVAQNFREQGNEQARMKQWREARDFYGQAVAALRGPNVKPQDVEEGPAEMDVVEVDEEEERAKERAIEEACFVNRALCNLELKNYRACNADCAATLLLNPANVKAWYRSASACLALDKIPEAADACTRGLEIDPSNAALKTLSTKISTRRAYLDAAERARQERASRAAAEKATLAQALKARNIATRTTDRAPDTDDAVVRLADPLDAASCLSVPVLLLYPCHAQSDFIKAFEETQALAEHLAYVLPPPWDEAGEYAAPGDVDCYLETAGGSGGLVKAGKKLALMRILAAGKVEIVDGVLKVYVVPRDKAAAWVAEFKRRAGRA